MQAYSPKSSSILSPMPPFKSPNVKFLSCTIFPPFLASPSGIGQRRAVTWSKSLDLVCIACARSSVQSTPKSPRCFSIMTLSDSAVRSLGCSGSLKAAFLWIRFSTTLNETGPQNVNGRTLRSEVEESLVLGRNTSECRAFNPSPRSIILTSLLPPIRPFRTAARMRPLLIFGKGFFSTFCRRRRSPCLLRAFLTNRSARIMSSLPFLNSFFCTFILAICAARSAAAFRFLSRRFRTVSATLMLSPGFRGRSTALP
mmetsp:Transcript_16648/g.29635  ORF Transcript_16648/g.29635 Transcript_16648/m.29635 type:complete len:256 (+) Transcript_16648:200-967(+)